MSTLTYFTLFDWLRLVTGGCILPYTPYELCEQTTLAYMMQYSLNIVMSSQLSSITFIVLFRIGITQTDVVSIV